MPAKLRESLLRVFSTLAVVGAVATFVFKPAGPDDTWAFRVGLFVVGVAGALAVGAVRPRPSFVRQTGCQ